MKSTVVSLLVVAALSVCQPITGLEIHIISFGENATLDCNPDNDTFTNGTYQWTFESELLMLDNATTMITVEYTNESSPATIGGQYNCTVDDLVERQFQVVLTPYITSPPTNVYTTVGNDIQFNCEAVGFPTPNITWEPKTNDTHVVAEVTAIINNTIQSILNISNVAAEDYGVYKCIADNGNSTDAIATLTVSPDAVTANPMNQTVSYGDTAVFNCTANGGPNNTFRWYYNSTEISNDGNYAITDDPMHSYSMLTISDVGSEHNGSYVCNVSNAAGYGNNSVELIVIPLQPSTSTSISTISTPLPPSTSPTMTLAPSSITLTDSIESTHSTSPPTSTTPSPSSTKEASPSSIMLTDSIESTRSTSPPTLTSVDTPPTTDLEGKAPSLSSDIPSQVSPSSTKEASPSSIMLTDSIESTRSTSPPTSSVDTPPTTDLEGKVSASTAAAIIVPVVIAPAAVVAIIGAPIVVGLLKMNRNKLRKKRPNTNPKRRRRNGLSERHIEMASQSYNQHNTKEPLRNETKFYGDKGRKVY